MFLKIPTSNHIDSDYLNFVVLLKIWTLQKLKGKHVPVWSRLSVRLPPLRARFKEILFGVWWDDSTVCPTKSSVPSFLKAWQLFIRKQSKNSSWYLHVLRGIAKGVRFSVSLKTHRMIIPTCFSSMFIYPPIPEQQQWVEWWSVLKWACPRDVVHAHLQLQYSESSTWKMILMWANRCRTMTWNLTKIYCIQTITFIICNSLYTVYII